VALPALRNYSMIELQGNLPVWNSDRPVVAQCLAQRQLNRAECGSIGHGVIRHAPIGGFRVQQRGGHTTAGTDTYRRDCRSR
jgi:hypothetical protein